MWKRPALHTTGFAVLFVVVAFWMGGCLECKESISGRYDDAQDRFVFLNIYQRISGQKPEDFDYLATLWNNRDHLITPPIPTILGKTSFLRISNDQFATLNLGDARKLEIEHSPLPLGQIKIEPGKFFLRGEDALCYFDQIVVPGNFVDKTLGVVSRLGRESLAKEVDKEKSRRQNGGKIFSWDVARRTALANIQKPAADEPAAIPNDNAGEAPESIFNLLSDKSLKMLESVSLDDSKVITRQKSILQLNVSITEKDAVEIVNLITVVRNAVDEGLKKPNHEKDLDVDNLVLHAYEVHANGGELAMTLRMIDLFNTIGRVMDPLGELPARADEASSLPYKNAVAAMKAKNIPIDSSLTVQAILNDFQSGQLKGFPPEKSVPPGEGLDR